MTNGGLGDALLSGPRGLNAVATAAALVDARVGEPLNLATWPEPAPTARQRLVTALRAVDPSGLARMTDPNGLLAALGCAVGSARYWQEPLEGDAVLASDEVRAALAPIAHALAGCPAAAWWTSGIELDSQRHVAWAIDGPAAAPELGRAAETMREWKVEATRYEHRCREEAEESDVPFSGYWWSSPRFPTPLTTTRALAPLDAVGLTLVEDGGGFDDADVRPMAPEPGCRVYEITGPDAWTDLVARYPFEVTYGRRHDWYRATGRAATWHIPDWERVAADHDAVHLTVAGYLTTAGRPLDVGDGATLLAGWDPDQTFWLADVLRVAGPPRSWHWDGGDLDREALGWVLEP